MTDALAALLAGGRATWLGQPYASHPVAHAARLGNALQELNAPHFWVGHLGRLVWHMPAGVNPAFRCLSRL